MGALARCSQAYWTLINGPCKSGKLLVLITCTPALCSPLNGVSVFGQLFLDASVGKLNHSPNDTSEQVRSWDSMAHSEMVCLRRSAAPRRHRTMIGPTALSSLCRAGASCALIREQWQNVTRSSCSLHYGFKSLRYPPRDAETQYYRRDDSSRARTSLSFPTKQAV